MPETRPLPVDSFLDFIWDLRQVGYSVSLRELLLVQDLLLGLASRGRFSGDWRELRSAVGPVVCSDFRQQDDFALRFDQWVRMVEAEREAPGDVARYFHDDVDARLRRLRQLNKLWRAALVALLVLSAAALFWHTYRTAVSPRDSAASGGASGGSTDPGQTGAQGPSRPGADAGADPDSGGAAAGEPRPAWRSWLGLVLLLAAALGSYAAWWRVQARRFLSRGASSSAPTVSRIAVGGTPPPLYRDPSAARVARFLRLRRSVDSQDLDIDATISRSLENAGWFTPVTGRRLEIPEYLVLVDRSSPRDHQAQAVLSMLDRLHRESVFLEVFYFDGDPRSLLSSEAAYPQTLSELSTKCPRHRLLIFSDGDSLIHPVTGEPQPWMGDLSAWNERALLTLEPRANWGSREHALMASGIQVLPATYDGLAASTDPLIATAIGKLEEDRGYPPLYPESLQNDARRWLSPNAPIDLERCLDELKAYLGDEGYTWLSACAVYPELRWELTLFLGNHLSGGHGASIFDQRRLIRLARLPWFRDGHMPDWLRGRLLDELSGKVEREVRALLRKLMLSGVTDPYKGFVLEIAEQDHGVLRQLWSKASVLWRHDVAPASPWRDRVFMSWMDNRLAVRLPKALARWLRQRRSRKRRDRRFRRRFTYQTAVQAAISILIAAIVATILIPNFLDALTKARQKRTMSDMRSVGIAWMSWLTDQVGASSAGQTKKYDASGFSSVSYEQMVEYLHPKEDFFYMAEVPQLDGWRHPLTFAMASDVLSNPFMSICSGGRDDPAGIPCNQTFDVGTFLATDYDQDIVWGDGYFVRYPAGVGRQ